MATTKSDKDKKKKKEKEKPQLSTLAVGGAVYQTTIPERYKRRKTWKSHNEGDVFSLITGAIKKILVKKGDHVAQGDCLLLLEAMKMSNEILSPVSGTIEEVLVAENNAIPKGTLMVRVCPDHPINKDLLPPEEDIFAMQAD